MVKGRALPRNGRLCLCGDQETAPHAFVMAEGQATIGRDPAERAAVAVRIAARYLGPDQTDAFGARNAVEGELVRVKMERVVATGGLTD